MNDIIVGVDQTPTARMAATQAAELAAAYRANLHVVMCVDGVSAGHVAVGRESFHIDTLAEADQFLADLTRKLPHDKVTHSVAVGEPAKMLCEEADRLAARTIVVGNRRVQGMSRVLGSVAGDVARKAPCNVLVVNTTEAAD